MIFHWHWNHIYVDYCLRQESPHIHCAAEYSMHDWKIDTSLLRGFRRNGHLVFPVQDARLKVLFWRGGGNKMPTATKKWQLAWHVYKVVVCNLFTFSFRVACFSILSDCLGMCGGFSLSSHHTPPSLFIDRSCIEDAFKKSAKESTLRC